MISFGLCSFTALCAFSAGLMVRNKLKCMRIGNLERKVAARDYKLSLYAATVKGCEDEMEAAKEYIAKLLTDWSFYCSQQMDLDAYLAEPAIVGSDLPFDDSSGGL